MVFTWKLFYVITIISYWIDLLEECKQYEFHLLSPLSTQNQWEAAILDKMSDLETQLYPHELLQKPDGRRDKQRGGEPNTQMQEPHPMSSLWSAAKLTLWSPSVCPCVCFSVSHMENLHPWCGSNNYKGSILCPSVVVTSVSCGSCCYQLLTKAKGTPEGQKVSGRLAESYWVVERCVCVGGCLWEPGGWWYCGDTKDGQTSLPPQRSGSWERSKKLSPSMSQEGCLEESETL